MCLCPNPPLLLRLLTDKHGAERVENVCQYISLPEPDDAGRNRSTPGVGAIVGAHQIREGEREDEGDDNAP